MNITPHQANLILQAILNIINDKGIDYLDTKSGQAWLSLLGINADIAKDALAMLNVIYLDE